MSQSTRRGIALPAIASALLVVAALLGGALPMPAAAAGGTWLERVSLTQSGTEISPGPDIDTNSELPAISADGRYVAFVSTSPQLVAGDTGDKPDVFVRDTLTDTNELISVASDGSHPNAFVVGDPVMTPDGRYVVFGANSSLTPGASGYGDVYLRDRTAGTTELVSRGLGGQVPDDFSAQGVQAITPDGRYVAFSSFSTNLVSGDTNGEPDLFVLDRDTGTTARASVSSTGTESNSDTMDSVYLAVAPSGHVLVAFHSNATNLVADDPGSGEFLHDMTTGETSRLVGTANAANVTVSDLSPDGALVVYQKGVGNNVQVFLLDRSDDSDELISANSAGDPGSSIGEGDISSSAQGNISDDGRYVGFVSDANNLVGNDTNKFCNGYDPQTDDDIAVSCPEAFVRDRLTNTTTRVSIADDGTQGDSYSYSARISPDGSHLVFMSYAGNLVPGDTNGIGDIFVRPVGFQPSAASEAVAPGGTVSTGANTNAALPVVASVTTPQGGAVSIDVGDTDQTAPGFNFFGQQLSISAPNATAQAPLEITFTLDGSLFPPGADPTTAQVLRTELPGAPSLVADCSATNPAIAPDPCISNRVTAGGGVTITVLTTQASIWNLGLGGPMTSSQAWLERVSLTEAGGEIQPGQDIFAGAVGSISSDGRYVAFTHTSPDLVPGDSSNSLDVFVRDTLTNTNELISLAADGSHPFSPISGGLLAMTPNGRYVAFTSYPALAPGATGYGDVYVRDRTLGTTELISRGIGGQVPDNVSGYEAGLAITPDGRYVAFESYATNLVAGDTNGQPDLFVFDRVSQSMERASVSTSGAQADSSTTDQADFAITAAGHVVLGFATGATNLVAGDPGRGMFLRDLTTHETTRIVDPPGTGLARLVDLSPDGTLVVFTVDVDNGFGRQAFVLDRSDSSIELISTNNLGEPTAAIGESASGLNLAGNISDDGRYVGFQSNAFNLVGDDTNAFCTVTVFTPHQPPTDVTASCPEAFVRDRLTHTTTRVSIADDGTQGNKDTFIPLISGDGTRVTFRSNSSNLVPGDTNGIGDIFVRPVGFQPSAASEAVAPGGTVSTGANTNAALPVVASVTTPQGGAVSIDVGDTDQTAPGFNFFGQQLSISAPNATAQAPLEITFTLDGSLFPPGADPTTAQVLRTELPGAPSLVADCSATNPAIAPDPCISNRVTAGGGVTITVLTTQASIWNLGLGGPAETIPVVTSFVPSTATTTNQTQIEYLLSFDSPITDLAAEDFAIGGTSTGWSVTAVDGSGSGPYGVVLSGPSSTEGTVDLTLNANSVADGSSGVGPVAPVGAATMTIDRTVPVVTGQQITPSTVPAGNTVIATASATDTRGVASGELRITSVSAPSYLDTVALNATDGAFDEMTEAMATTFPAPPNSGTYLVCALAYDEASNVSAGTGCRTLTVTKLSQTVTFASPGTKTMAQSPLMLNPTATSGLFVNLTSNTPLICTATGHSVTLLAAGTCSLSASQSGNITYNASNTVTRAFTVNQGSQSISFANPGTRTMAQSPLTVTPTATSGLAVTITSTTPAICAVSGFEVTLLGPGSCSLSASQAGDAAYKPATTVVRTFTVTKVNQSITFVNPGATSLGASPLLVSPTATSGLTVLLNSTTPAVCTVDGFSITLLSVGSCAIRAQQAGDSIYNAANPITRTFTVTKIDQTINFPAPGPRSMASPIVHTGVSASSGLVVTLTTSTKNVCTVSGSDITLLKAGTCTVKASQAGNASYNAAPTVTRTFTVTLSPGSAARLANRESRPAF